MFFLYFINEDMFYDDEGFVNVSIFICVRNSFVGYVLYFKWINNLNVLFIFFKINFYFISEYI